MPEPEVTRVANPPSRPRVLYDGDCGFCRFWVDRWHAEAGSSVRFDPFQQAAHEYPEIPPERFKHAMQLVDTDGKVFGGADAVFRLWRDGRLSWVEWLMRKVPPLLALARILYAFVSSHRPLASRLTRIGWGADSRPPTFGVARRVFAHALGLVFLSAFGSLFVQWRGLIGSGGIFPISRWMDPAHERIGSLIYLRVPSVFWLNHSDATVLTVCVLGVVLSLVLACGLLPGPMALVLWALY